jgi:hypothetical protein
MTEYLVFMLVSITVLPLNTCTLTKTAHLIYQRVECKPTGIECGVGQGSLLLESQ